MATHLLQFECKMELKMIIIGVWSILGNGSCEKGISLKHLYYYYVYVPESLLVGMHIPYLILHV